MAEDKTMSDPTEEALEPPNPEKFKAGSFGCHEALDRTALLMRLVHELSEHDAIRLVPEWEALADKAGDALFELYQAIGAAHLAAPAETEGSHGKESIRKDR